MQIKTEELSILIAVFDLGSFSAAAKMLDIPVSKVTRAIAKLEDKYGTQLFYRTTRKIEPSEPCIEFVAKVRQSLEQLNHAEDILQRAHIEPSGWIRVDAVTSFILHQLVPLMPSFNKQFPDISIELVSNQNIIDLVENRTDIAIRIGNLPDSNLHYTVLGKSYLKLVASPEYVAKHRLPESLTECLKHKIIGFTRGSHLNIWPLEDGNIEITPTMTGSDGETILQLCLAGHGIALLSNFTVERYLDSGQLIEVLPNIINKNSARHNVYAVYFKDSNLSKRLGVFIEFLKENLSL